MPPLQAASRSVASRVERIFPRVFMGFLRSGWVSCRDGARTGGSGCAERPLHAECGQRQRGDERQVEAEADAEEVGHALGEVAHALGKVANSKASSGSTRANHARRSRHTSGVAILA